MKDDTGLLFYNISSYINRNKGDNVIKKTDSIIPVLKKENLYKLDWK